MKKVLVFSLAYYPRFVGGAEVAIKEITDRINPEDIEFHLVTLRFDSNLPREEKIDNVYVHRIGWGKEGATVGTSYGVRWLIDKILFIPLAARKGILLNRVQHFDGVWAMMTYMALPVTLMRFFGVSLPYVLTLQDGDPFEHVFGRPRIKLILPLLRAGFRNATVIQTISNFLAQWPGKMGYIGPIVVVPNGTDTARFAAGTSKDIGKKEGEVFLCTASRLVSKNALDDVIRALPELPENISFAVFGTGPEEADLRSLAQRLGVTARVKFFGSIDNRDLPGYLHACDIFIRPSRSEGMGISFIEAFAAGLPVIATQEGGIADFLFDAKRNPGKPTTGWAVDRDNPAQIAAVVKEILGDPARTKAVVEEARRLAVAQYDWSRMARDMQEKVFAKVFKN